jgi:hypothetical protein
MRKRHKARRHGHAAKKKTAAKKKSTAKAWPVKKVIANIETRLAHVESHLAQAGHARGRRHRRRR